MVKFKVSGKEVSDSELLKKAKRYVPSTNGGQMAAEVLRAKGLKVEFFNTKSNRWNRF